MYASCTHAIKGEVVIVSLVVRWSISMELEETFLRVASVEEISIVEVRMVAKILFLLVRSFIFRNLLGTIWNIGWDCGTGK